MNADIKKEIRDNIGDFLLVSLVLFPFIILLILAIQQECKKDQDFKQLNEQLSQIQSNLEIQPTTVILQLPEDSFVYDTQGGAVTGDSQISFNTGSDNLSFKISYPNGLERGSTSVELYSEKNKGTYQIKHKTRDENVTSVKLLISGLDTSLNWFLNQTRISPSENRELEVEITPQRSLLFDETLSRTTILIGYSPKDNSIQDGIILEYIP